MDKRCSSSISTSSVAARETLETEESSLKLFIRDDGGSGGVIWLARGRMLGVDGVL